MNKEIIFIGLGRMGQAMTAQLVEKGYLVRGFDVSEAARNQATLSGVITYESITEAAIPMTGRKVVWMMVPAKFVDDVLTELYSTLTAGDIIIDGGNTFYKDTLTRAATAAEKNIHYIDCGTSGGVEGARNGASLMVGGPAETVNEIEDIFITLAAKDAYGHVGKSGAGHFVKMVHNSIEYGMMGAIAEGFAFIEENESEFNIEMPEVIKAYKNGSIITSSLISWLADSYQTDGYLDSIAGEVPKGETEKEMEYIVSQKPAPILSAALTQRKDTREKASRVGTLISAMRNQFGGHKTIEKQ
jgi:6-phosphogluconate dehydrogenase